MIGYRNIIVLMLFIGLSIGVMPALATWVPGSSYQINTTSYDLPYSFNNSTAIFVNLTSLYSENTPYSNETATYCWRFDDDLIDSCGGKNGLWKGVAGNANYTPMKYNDGGLFNGTDFYDYVYIGTSASVPLPFNFSGMFYMNLTDNSTTREIIHNYTVSSGTIGTPGNFIIRTTTTNGVAFILTNQSLTTEVWYYGTADNLYSLNETVEFSFNINITTGKVKLWKNGVLLVDTTGIRTTYSVGVTHGFTIGKGRTSTSNFSGKLDNVKLWNRHLSDTEHVKEYNTRTSQLLISSNNGLSGYWNGTENNSLPVPTDSLLPVQKLNFTGPETATLDGVTVYEAWKNMQFRLNSYEVYAPLQLLSPLNNSVTTNPITLRWYESINDTPYLYYISTDTQFINTVEMGLGTTNVNDTSYITTSLPYGNTYYWRVQNGTGAYSETWVFTLSAAPITPGSLNISARDEQTNTTISTFTATLYNSTATINKTSTAGWANFTSAQVASGEYLVRVNATGYAPRNILVTSPNTAVVYLPSTASNTINTIAFYLVDTTGRFPWTFSKLTITKSGLVISSSYYDADTKVAAYLIQGDPYALTVSYGSNIQNWGNYIPISSGNVEMLITDIGINTTQIRPFVYTITYNTSAIVLNWTDAGTLTTLNFSIFKGNTSNMVHNLVTSVSYGQSAYVVTNTSDVYYISFVANTTQGNRVQYIPVDYRSGTARTDRGLGNAWQWGSFAAPEWVKTVVAILVIVLLSAGFGAIYAELGAVVTIIMTLFMLSWNILSGIGAFMGFFGGLAVVLVLYYVKARDTTLGMMAYKAALFLIFFNFAIMIINGSGIVPGVTVDIFGNDCQGDNANSAGCILARISTLAPEETSYSGLGQITFLLVTATAFGLIVLTLQFMLGIFWFGYGISTVFLNQLPIGWEWKLVLNAGCLIIYVTGFMQYKAGSGGSLRDKE